MVLPEHILWDIENKAEENKWPIIGSIKSDILKHAIWEFRPMRVLEVGTLVGYSAILMSEIIPQGGKIVSIEIDPKIAEIARKNFARAEVSDRIELIVGDALQVIPSLPGPFHMVFLDAAKEQYLQYLKLAEPKMAPRAIVVADNVKIFAKQMKDYLEYVRKSGLYVSQKADFGFDAVEVSVRKET